MDIVAVLTGVVKEQEKRLRELEKELDNLRKKNELGEK